MMDHTKKYFLPHVKLQDLLDGLQKSGYACIGPQVRDGAIVYDELSRADQLPWGIRDYQSPGEYRIEKIPENKAFAFSNGAQAIKPILFKPQETVWKVMRDNNGKLTFQPQNAFEKPVAIIGARACDIAGMIVQDKVFLDEKNTDSRYQGRREKLFVVAVNCTYASDNCFCVSAGTGPKVKNNFDIAMTEIDDGFVVEIGTHRGFDIINQLSLTQSHLSQENSAQKNESTAASMQTKTIPFNNTGELRDLLMSNLDHPRWEEVANKCLSCGNCTSVCPTCFCHSEVEKPSLDGSASEHQSEWDSCFNEGHSYFGGKVLRDDTKKQYRQWLTHKVGTWWDQFDTSGCIGCGRCVTWCPVGIDLTEELRAIAEKKNGN